jgi:glycosyltransferase involved in cell wall biosynthesis
VLESLKSQECDWSSLAEIIIVDNNSTDGTEQLIHSYTASYKTKFRYFKETKQGKSYALNLAITVSQSDVLVFTDDDVILDSQWLNEIIQFFNETEVDVLGGRVLPLYPPQTPQWVKENRYALRGPIVSYDYGEDIIDYSSGRISEFIGANMAYKKNVFETTGLFNTDLGVGRGLLGEDIDMIQRAAQAGKKMFYNGKALLWHPIDPKRMTLRYLAQWNFQQGTSTAMLETIKTNQKIFFICGVPRYMFRSIILELIKLFLTIFQPGLFLKSWCSFYFNLGRIAGYAKQNRLNSLKEG